MIGIVQEMNVFGGPQRTVGTEDTHLLATPDGWFLLTGEWLDDDPRVTARVKVLRLDYEMFFSPTKGPTAEQDMGRLDWVTWSR